MRLTIILKMSVSIYRIFVYKNTAKTGCIQRNLIAAFMFFCMNCTKVSESKVSRAAEIMWRNNEYRTADPKPGIG